MEYFVKTSDGIIPLDISQGLRAWLDEHVERHFRSRKDRLFFLELKAGKRVRRRQALLTAALVLDRDEARIAYWRARIAEAQRLTDNLWLARVNPQVPR